MYRDFRFPADYTLDEVANATQGGSYRYHQDNRLDWRNSTFIVLVNGEGWTVSGLELLAAFAEKRLTELDTLHVVNSTGLKLSEDEIMRAMDALYDHSKKFFDGVVRHRLKAARTQDNSVGFTSGEDARWSLPIQRDVAELLGLSAAEFARQPSHLALATAIQAIFRWSTAHSTQPGRVTASGQASDSQSPETAEQAMMASPIRHLLDDLLSYDPAVRQASYRGTLIELAAYRRAPNPAHPYLAELDDNLSALDDGTPRHPAPSAKHTRPVFRIIPGGRGKPDLS